MAVKSNSNIATLFKVSILLLLLTSCAKGNSESKTTTNISTVPPSQGISSSTTSSLSIQDFGQVFYANDQYSQGSCDGTGNLYYDVLGPTNKGRYPILFGITGTGFKGAAGCGSNGKAVYLGFNSTLANFAKAGFIVVNIEYHGYTNGLFGGITYPGSNQWGFSTDATVQLDVMKAIETFLKGNPSQYGADPSKGIVVFGSSSGAHCAYMVGSVGIKGFKISAVIGWSGLPDVSLSGSYPQSVFDKYMDTTRNSDIENFGDPNHRAHRSMPPTYIANGLKEFISPVNAETYYSTLQKLGVVTWLRIPNTSLHAASYENYVFRGVSPELSSPAAANGTTVLQDSINFAKKFVS